MFYNDIMGSHLFLFFQDISSTKNSPMFYSNSNGDKNYVIWLVILKKKLNKQKIYQLIITTSNYSLNITPPVL